MKAMRLPPMVHVSGRLPLADFTRLVDLAERRGLVRKGRPNVSKALQEAVALGLAAERENAQEVTR